MIVDPIHAARAEAERLCAQNFEVLKHQAELDVLQEQMPEAPRWSEWHRRPTVELWQAVTLALNVEPIALKTVFAWGPGPCKEELDYWAKVLSVGPPKKSRFEAFAPVQVERREVLRLPRRRRMERHQAFSQELERAIEWLEEPDGIKPKGAIPTDVGTTQVRLVDFVAWATRQGWKLPVEMVPPAVAALPQTAAGPTPATSEGHLAQPDHVAGAATPKAKSTRVGVAKPAMDKVGALSPAAAAMQRGAAEAAPAAPEGSPTSQPEGDQQEGDAAPSDAVHGHLSRAGSAGADAKHRKIRKYKKWILEQKRDKEPFKSFARSLYRRVLSEEVLRRDYLDACTDHERVIYDTLMAADKTDREVRRQAPVPGVADGSQP